ncbi:hypothetical protein Syun_000885 [Stephania yunnanensis]|uniref:Uncharacterized protein n=1 Tax=Stephania yunnanensis TaxID=152371 RepID=A0AAP0Q5Z3_9MAGN
MKTSLIILVTLWIVTMTTTPKARVLEESKSASHEDQNKEINVVGYHAMESMKDDNDDDDHNNNQNNFISYNGKEVSSVNMVDDNDDDSSTNHSRGSSSTTHRSISIDDYRRMFRDVPGRP